MNANPRRWRPGGEVITNSSGIYLIPGESEAAVWPKELLICNSYRPRTTLEGSPPSESTLPALVQARATTGCWSCDWSPSSGAGAWPTTLEEPGRTLHQATVLFHCTARPPHLAFCCADKRPSEPGRPIRNPPELTLRDAGRDVRGNGNPRKRRGIPNAPGGA